MRSETRGLTDEAVAGTLTWQPMISAWFGQHQIAESVPIISGRSVYSVSQEVPDTLDITVPSRTPQRVWIPKDARDPLSRFGSELQVMLRIIHRRTIYDVPVGRYMVHDWELDDSGQIKVVGKGLLQRAVDDQFATPQRAAGAASFATEARRLAPPGVTVAIHPDLVDRAVPKNTTWGTSRIEALYEIADSWPARIVVDGYGIVHFLPVVTGNPRPVVTFTDGEGGTLVKAPRSDSRDGIYNHIVVESQEGSNGKSFVAEALVRGGALDYRTYGKVTQRYSSDLINNKAKAQEVANNMAANAGRNAHVLPVEIVPDPRLIADDPVEILKGDVQHWGWINGWDMPLTAKEGVMRIDVGVSN
jgi:hypothetical protein